MIFLRWLFWGFKSNTPLIGVDEEEAGLLNSGGDYITLPENGAFFLEYVVKSV